MQLITTLLKTNYKASKTIHKFLMKLIQTFVIE